MTILIVNGIEHVVKMTFGNSDIDISQDFIGNTYHGMEIDNEGNYLASQEDLEYWLKTIEAHQEMERTISQYKDKFDIDEVENVVNYAMDTDLDMQPKSVEFALIDAFGKID